MTRWARGGPANKKKPEEATPWSEMQDAETKKEEEKPSEKAKQKEEDAEFEKRHLALRRKMAGPSASNGIAAQLEKLKKETEDSEAKKEITSVIKKEERREKRRQKRIVARDSGKMCFNCRETGHDISSCPKNSSGQGTGICFKCGSTEHSLNQCKIKVPPGHMPYAKCFVCGEMGHLSKQCTDNPRGLYPNGGSCRVCGSVEHFKRDCPELQQKQGIPEMRLKLNVGVEEHCDWSEEPDKPPEPAKKKAKVVKF